MVTAGTYRKTPIFNTPDKLGLLQAIITERCSLLGWNLQAWAILTNHYHFIAQAPTDGRDIQALIRSIHSMSAILVNRMDGITGRRVWYNYWDTCIRSETEFIARLKYVLHNPERHGVVEDFREYPYSSYLMFAEKNDEALRTGCRLSDEIDLTLGDEY
jgi:putative transposase